MFAKIALAALSATAFAATAPAHAADATRSVTVRYGDLNLAQPAGQDLLDARIRRAAATVCGAPGEQLATIRAAYSCRSAATADARARLALVVASNDMRGGSTLVVAR